MKRWIWVAVITFVAAFLLSVSQYEQKPEDVYNQARVLLQDDLERLKKSDMKELDYSFYVIGLDGIVLSTNLEEYPIGKKVNVTKELQTDHAFTDEYSGKLKVVFPLQDNEQITSFAIFLIDENAVEQPMIQQILRCFWPIIVWSFGIIVGFIILAQQLKKKIYEPMDEICESSAAIIAGDYSKALIQRRTTEKPDGAVEKLTYSFEMMREELRSKSQREEQLKKSQKELMSCMSHDLRTPITTIQAHAEAMRDGIVKTEERRADYLNIIIRKATTLNKMIADLLDHSNAELNQMKIEKSECYFGAYLEALSVELKTYCAKQDCEFEYKNSAEEMLILMDQSRITQVIYNLVENACKYMKQKVDASMYDDDNKQKVTLRCYQEKEERRLVIEVEDNGPGIEMMDIPYVFDRFYRAEKSRSMQIPGAGLGLSICKYIVEQHNGEIMLQSHKGEGTTVMFYLNY